ncbi:MAG: SulP family inorganic anion transporter [Eubacteriales bacterium]|nr:SulP family inorganic anion transporter [Eubacteriales bacterium]
MKPELFYYLQGYNRRSLTKDIIAGIIVGIIAIPLSVALAIASGASPSAGLYTAILAGFTAAMLGGSAMQVTGPTGAFVVIVYGIIADHGLDGLIAATLIAGVILLAMGLLKLGSVIRYIPFPITVGFTAGIALTILAGQLNDFFGFGIAKMPAEFIEKMIVYAEHLDQISWPNLVIGLIALAIIILWPKINRLIPGSLVAIVVTTILIQFVDLPVATIGSRFPDLSGGFPAFRVPHITFGTLRDLIQPALTIAILGGVESLLSAVVGDSMANTKHDSSQELIGQGAANIVSSLFGGLPATGAIARTAANIRNGAISPVSSIVHSITILTITLLFLPYAKMIPMATIAAILIIISKNMIEIAEIKKLLKAPKTDRLLLLSTFFLTVVFDLVIAIEVGVVLAAIFFMKRMADVATIKEHTVQGHPALDSVAVYRLNGPFFFAAAESLIQSIDHEIVENEAIILEMQRVPAIDATAVNVLEKLARKCHEHHTRLYFSHLQAQPMDVLRQSGFITEHGEQFFVTELQDALEACNDLMN